MSLLPPKPWHWQTKTHMAMSDRWLLLQYSPELGIYKQTETIRKGYKVTGIIYFFEAHPDAPEWTDFGEILEELEYQRAIAQDGAA